MPDFDIRSLLVDEKTRQMRLDADRYLNLLKEAEVRFIAEGRPHGEMQDMIAGSAGHVRSREWGAEVGMSPTQEAQHRAVYGFGLDGIAVEDFHLSQIHAGKIIEAYLQEAKNHGLDLLKEARENPPPWLAEARGDPKRWLEIGKLERFKKVEDYRSDSLMEKWKSALDGLPEGAACLDVGCGSGFFVRKGMEYKPGFKWHGTDLERDMPTNGTELDRNKASWFKTCEKGTLPYPDASMDAVFLNNVLHHVDEEGVPGLLAEVRRVLKPGGKLLVTEEHVPHIVHPGTDSRVDSFPKIVDHFFWPQDLGSQKKWEEWRNIISQNGLNYDRHMVSTTFGTPGLPVMENYMEFSLAA